MFGQHPADALGILDEGVRSDLLLCAWHVLGEEDEERRKYLAEVWGL